jgi:acyl carrier protein
MSDNSDTHDVENRLTQCFMAVFPNLSSYQVFSATRDDIPNWDSLTAVTLVSVVEQEFCLELDADFLEETGSVFAAVLSRIKVSAAC